MKLSKIVKIKVMHSVGYIANKILIISNKKVLIFLRRMLFSIEEELNFEADPKVHNGIEFYVNKLG